MQPTATASVPAPGEMDLQALQSMDWLFKKERFHLLAQFWQHRATLAEKENASLKEQLINNANSGDHKDINNMDKENNSRSNLEVEVATKDKEIVQLIEQVHRLQSTLQSIKETSRTQIQRLEEQLEHNRQHINRLESRLDSQRDYEDVKREISILRSVDLSVVNQQLNESNQQPSLELLLLERQKAAAAAVAAAAAAAASAAVVSETNNNNNNNTITTSSNSIHNTTSTVALSPIITTSTPPATTTLSSSLTSSTTSNITSSLLKPPSTPETPGVQTPQPSQTPDSQHHQEHPNNLVINNNNNSTNENNNNTTSSNNNQTTTPTSLLPPPLQNVEQFGSFLGEEIVANWRRTLERPLPPMLTNSQQQLLAANHLNTNCNNELQQLIRQPPAPTPSPAPQQLDTPIKASTPLICAPPDSEKSTASTPVPTDSISSGARASPTEAKSEPEDNNNHHLSNNNLSALNAAAMCNFLREDVNSLKSPYRFEEHRTFRFADDLGSLPPGAMVGRLGESLIPKGDPMEARLQEMLRYNMDKYATQNLDTLTIARRVRELLSIHNIGQRLFAKYVLGLSQGTVSELLSKPKPWDKLTEKGRDSYRKMHAWACDENAVMLLKSLIPKKVCVPGKDTGMPTYGGRESSDMSDDRIAHILNEASHIMKVEDTHSNDDSNSPSHGQCPSPFSKESSQNRKLKKYENDDIPQEKVLRIYQEELAKLMGRRMEDMRNTREPFTNGGVTMDRNQEEMRIALDAYHRELAKLNQCPPAPGAPGLPNLPGLLALQQQVLAQQNHLNGAQDLSLPKEKSSKIVNGTPELMESQQQREMMQKEDSQDPTSRHSGSAFSLVRPKVEPGVVQSNTNSSAPSPLGNSILPPAMTPTDEFTGAAAASPLQRMASITNSLISQPPTQSHHSPSQRPLKAVLPPITQQQFDLFNNLNTEDIVKKVKEQLSQYSISQRLFGESVLGLSQGSVSDLLARPKPWHMLTQKGREPFIRMKMFLEDDNAVHKLVASQYKIAPEKLMRTGGYGGSPCTSMQAMNKPPMPMPQTPKMMSEAAGLLNKIQQENHSALLPPSLQLGPPTSQPNMVQPPPPPMMLTPPGLPPHHPINLQNPEQLKKSQSPHPIQHSPMGQQSSHMRSLHQHISPSVYEMAALTQDLDTQTITTKIKEALLANNIGQKIFGEAVLGLSQGSVSELLSKPKPWHMLSIKGREPFIRMQLWLSDAHNIDRLQALKNERREANKRRRSTGPGAHDNSSDTSSNDTSEFYHSNSPGPGPGPPSAKKQRVLFSEEQKEALRLAFHLDPYPNVATIEFLAAELNLSSRTITNWFHNHRMRLKQQSPHGVPNDIPVRDQSGNQPPFDPVQFRLLLNQRLLELQKERIGLGAVPLPYPPYFATNTNLAALISRGLLPTGDVDLSALNNAVKEEMSGLDLSMTSLKREPSGEYDDEDCESNVGSEVSNISGGSLHGELKPEPKELPIPQIGNTPRSSRRKPAAPQWVKPDWQEEPKDKPAQPPQPQPTGNEVIINGVCVMQTEDYGRLNSEETVRVEPTPVMDRFEDDRSDASSVSAQETESIHENENPRITSHNRDPEDDENDDRTDCPPPLSLPPTQSELPEQDMTPVTIKTENEDERWDY